MENGMSMMNGEGHERSRSPSPGFTRSGSRNSLGRESRTSLLRRNQSLSAKQIRFYRNGDKFFGGLKLAVSAERYREFDTLLAELSEKLDLSTGAVRYIFNAETGKSVRDVSELQYGYNYVCSSSSSFRDVENGYGRSAPQWSVAHHSKNEASSGGPKLEQGPKDFIKPKLVTVIKSGKQPQKKVTMLLNSKTALSLDQVLDHLSSKGTIGKVDKLFTTDGAQVKELRHLFNDDTVFIALSSSEKFPEEGFDIDVQSFSRPPWKFSPASYTPPYTPGLRPEPPPPHKAFTVHVHCILAATSMNFPTTPAITPRRCKSARARSASPRVLFSRSSNRPSPYPTPRSSASFRSVRPKSAASVERSTRVTPRPQTPPQKKETAPVEFTKKALKPAKMNENGPMKPAKPKAGSDKPVVIRPRRFKPPPDNPEKPPAEEGTDEENSAREGYYIYVHNEQQRKGLANGEAKPTASVKPMLASEVKADFDVDQLDLKPLTFNITPTDSLEAINAY